MDWEKNNKTYQILKAAEEGKYGVVAPIAEVASSKFHDHHL